MSTKTKLISIEENTFIRYIISSLTSGGVELGSFFLMNTLLGMNYVIAAILSFVFSTIVGYIMKRKLAFRNNYRPRRKQFTVFGVITIGGIILNTGAVILLVESTNLVPTIAKIAGILIAFIYNYFMSKYITFKVMK